MRRRIRIRESAACASALAIAFAWAAAVALWSGATDRPAPYLFILPIAIVVSQSHRWTHTGSRVFNLVGLAGLVSTLFLALAGTMALAFVILDITMSSWDFTPWTRRLVIIAGISLAGVMALRVYVTTQTRLVLRHCRFSGANQVPGFGVIRLVHISDVHMGGTSSVSELIRACNQVRALQPDLVFLSGDIVDSSADSAYELKEVLDHTLQGQTIYAVLGNHDLFAGSNEVCEALRHTSVHLLSNETRCIELPDSNGANLRILISGLEPADGIEQRPPGETVDAIKSSAYARVPDLHIVMNHFPQTAEAWGLPTGRPTVILAGHTHGGQIALPFLPQLVNAGRLFSRYVLGIYSIAPGTFLSVNAGLGESVFRLRIGVPREITVLDFDSAALRHSKSAAQDTSTPAEKSHQWPDGLRVSGLPVGNKPLALPR